MTITVDELLDALAQAAQGNAPEDARTVAELMAATGLGERRVRAALRTLHAQGRLLVHRMTRLDIAGRPQQVPAYTILPATNATR